MIVAVLRISTLIAKYLQMTPDQPAYQYQIITVENRTLKLRWSADVPYNGSRPLAAIIAGPNDERSSGLGWRTSPGASLLR